MPVNHTPPLVREKQSPRSLLIWRKGDLLSEVRHILSSEPTRWWTPQEVFEQLSRHYPYNSVRTCLYVHSYRKNNFPNTPCFLLSPVRPGHFMIRSAFTCPPNASTSG